MCLDGRTDTAGARQGDSLANTDRSGTTGNTICLALTGTRTQSHTYTQSHAYRQRCRQLCAHTDTQGHRYRQEMPTTTHTHRLTDTNGNRGADMPGSGKVLASLTTWGPRPHQSHSYLTLEMWKMCLMYNDDMSYPHAWQLKSGHQT